MAYAELVLKYAPDEKRGSKGSSSGGKFVTDPSSGRQHKLHSSKLRSNARGLAASGAKHKDLESNQVRSKARQLAEDDKRHTQVPASHTAAARGARNKLEARMKATQGAKHAGRSKRYRIVHGDTLWDLARKYGTTVNAIMDANPQIKNRNLIYAGQTITIPTGKNTHIHGTAVHTHAGAVGHTHASSQRQASLTAPNKEVRSKVNSRLNITRKSYADMLSAEYEAAEGPYAVLKRNFDAEQRKKAAASGAAMPGGGFPIMNAEDLHNAMQAVGRAKDPEKAKAHIRARAKALGLESELTPAFKALLLPEDSAVVSVLKSLDESKYSLGLAYPANKLDGHKEFMSQETVEKTAWRWLKDHRQIGLAHMDGTIGHGTVVESYIYRGPDWETVDSAGKRQVIKSGDWLMGAVWDDVAWPLVKSGRFDGWSMQGMSARRAMPRSQAKL